MNKKKLIIYIASSLIVILFVFIWFVFSGGFTWLYRENKPSNIKKAVENGKELFDQEGGVVAVLAHPDDAEYYCGGTLAELAQSGHKVVVVVCTTEAGDVGEVRKKEQRKAAAILGYQKVIFLDYSDRSLKVTGKLVDELRAIYNRESSKILFTFDALKEGKVYHHPDHKAAGKAALEAAEGEDFSGVYLFHSASPNTWVEISEKALELKTEAFIQHKSQRPLGLPIPGNHIRRVLEAQGSAVGLKYAEIFRKL